jgi:hypothetical protein
MDFTVTTVRRVICLSLTAIIQDILENVGRDLNINLNGLLCLPFLHVGFDVTDNLFQLD